MKRSFFQIACLLIICLGMSQWTAEAVNCEMPFKYRNSQNGQTIEGTETFVDVGYLTTGTYCAANHRDPDGSKYNHAHLPHHFTFTPPGGSDQVTAEKSDWAWDADYTSYTRASGSTFSKNCFAHAAGSPEVMFHDGWTQFTAPSSKCENTSKGKSYGDAGHVVAITGIYTFPEASSCVISSTSEKNASSGVYTHGWLPIGQDTTQPVRKNK